LAPPDAPEELAEDRLGRRAMRTGQSRRKKELNEQEKEKMSKNGRAVHKGGGQGEKTLTALFASSQCECLD